MFKAWCIDKPLATHGNYTLAGDGIFNHLYYIILDNKIIHKFTQVSYNLESEREQAIQYFNKYIGGNIMKKHIECIRRLLDEGLLDEAYDMMIDLNRYDERVDNYTRYYIVALDLDNYKELGFKEDDILVECVFCGYMLATAQDIHDTLDEIEYYLIEGGK